LPSAITGVGIPESDHRKDSGRDSVLAINRGVMCMPRVLVADDQRHVRGAIVLALEANGFSVATAENGTDALKLFQASKFDLVVVDIYMPGIDGVKLIKAMRARDPAIAVLAISGIHLRASGRTALDLLPLDRGIAAIATLQKPFRSSQLLRAIKIAFDLAA
jgi:CheY-like chemotaxis protein